MPTGPAPGRRHSPEGGESPGNPDLPAFRARVRRFVACEITPHLDRWEEAGEVGREAWRAAGRHGLLGLEMPREHGGGGVDDPRHAAVLTAELATAGAAGPGLSLHTDVAGPSLRDLATPEQRRRWLPGFCSGELVAALAAAETVAGADVRELRTTAMPVPHGDGWILNGHEALAGNGTAADVVIVAARTDHEEADAGTGGVSLLVVERGMPGFARDRHLPGIGPRARDVADLFFTGVHVPRANLLGDEGGALAHLRRHRPAQLLSTAIAALASAESVFALAARHGRRRAARGRALRLPEHVRGTLAELATELHVGRAFVDRCVTAPGLDAAAAAMASWWCTRLHRRVVGRCLEIHEGRLDDHPIAAAYLDPGSPASSGGAELAAEIIGSALGLGHRPR